MIIPTLYWTEVDSFFFSFFFETDDDYDEDEDEDEMEDDLDESSLELGCPFCLEDYDALGLCLHVQDQHLIETKSGVLTFPQLSLKKNNQSQIDLIFGLIT